MAGFNTNSPIVQRMFADVNSSANFRNYMEQQQFNNPIVAEAYANGISDTNNMFYNGTPPTVSSQVISGIPNDDEYDEGDEVANFGFYDINEDNNLGPRNDDGTPRHIPNEDDMINQWINPSKRTNEFYGRNISQSNDISRMGGQGLISPIMIPNQDNGIQNPLSYDQIRANSIYNGMYNPMYTNPQTMYERQQILAREEARKESSIWKMMAKCASTFLGKEETKETLKRFDPVSEEEAEIERYKTKKPEKQLKVSVVCTNQDGEVIKIYKGRPLDSDKVYNDPKSRYLRDKEEKETYERLCKVEATGEAITNYIADRIIENHNRIYDAAKAEYPDTMGLAEFLCKAGKLYSESLVMLDTQRKVDRITQDIYNSARYGTQLSPRAWQAQNQIVTNMIGDPEYTGIRSGPNIGSLEITVPLRLRQSEVERRRAEFLSAIIR